MKNTIKKEAKKALSFLYVFNDGGFSKSQVTVLPDRYVRLSSGMEVPFEDIGDAMLSEEDYTEDEAFELWCKGVFPFSVE